MMNRLMGCFLVWALGPIMAFAVDVGPLDADTAALTGGNLVVELDHRDFTETTTNTAQTVQLFEVDATMGVELVAMFLPRAFEETGNAAHNSSSITVGDGSDPDRFLTATELNVNGTEVNLKYGTTTQLVYTSSDTVDLVITPSAADSVDELNKGKIKFYFKLLR